MKIGLLLAQLLIAYKRIMIDSGLEKTLNEGSPSVNRSGGTVQDREEWEKFLEVHECEKRQRSYGANP